MPQLATGTGAKTNFDLTFSVSPNGGYNPIPVTTPLNAILRGHVDISGIIATGVNQDPIFGTTLNTNIPSTSIYPAVYITALDSNGNSMVVQDSGQFLSVLGQNVPNYGLLMNPGTAPFGYTVCSGGYSTTKNTVNYLAGTANVNFPRAPAAGTNISAQCLFFQTGLPRAALFYNNTITLRMPPSNQYLVELDAYLSPSAFLSTSAAMQFGYMSEYIARFFLILVTLNNLIFMNLYLKNKNYLFGKEVKDNLLLPVLLQFIVCNWGMQEIVMEI